jgi:hypothetical protein
MVIILRIAATMPGRGSRFAKTAVEGACSRADVTDSMPRAQEVDEVSPGIFVWQAYDSKIKADLFSTALETPAGTYLVDPIPLGSDGLLSLRAQQRVIGIFVTSANHTRAAAEFAKIFAVPIFVHHELRGSPDFLQARWVQDGEVFPQGLTAVAIDGGPAGETALHYNGNGGSMVLGDALINFEPHGFGLLPAKYCLDASLMRRSLGKLLDYAFERMLFAHGTPILSGARARVQQLLTTIP